MQKKAIEKNLKALLKEAGITSADFARDMDITPQVLNNWFKRGVPFGREFQVAGRLGVEVSQISQNPSLHLEQYQASLNKTPETVEELFDIIDPMLDKFTEDQISELKGWLEAKRRAISRK